jgi:tyrosyl-tRNA synthetase
MKRFHELGHKVIVLVGDFTAMIGDPSDKTTARQKLTPEQIHENLKTFKRQIGKILDFDDKNNPIEFKFNSKWLSSLTFEDAVELASNFTVQQMIERDAFQKRLSENKPLYVHEFFYPLMQGYDSVAMDVDIEIGGTDQTFNMMAGRTLLKRYKGKEKFVMTTTLLENPVTGEKLMSKSLGTGVGLDEDSAQMFGKIMALPDEGLIQCFVDCTYLSLEEIKQIENDLMSGSNPRDIKLRLARVIVTMYHSEKQAEVAENDWLAKFSHRDKNYIPENAKELALSSWRVAAEKDIQRSALIAACATNIPQSMSEANRLFQQGALKINGEKITDASISPKAGDIFQIGKKHYFRIVD